MTMAGVRKNKYGPKSVPVEEQFFRHVEKTDGCWLWTAHRDKDGYGRITYMRRSGFGAHVLSYIIHKGDPGKLHVLHTCDNPSCVNPAHLYAGTRSENMKDMITRGRRRSLKGEGNGNARLTNDQASEIRYLYALGNWTQRHLALRFGISCATVSNILNGKRYATTAGKENLEAA